MPLPDYAQPVFETIHAAGIDPEQAVIIGGGVLAIHGIRPCHDIDMVVHPEAMHDLLAAFAILAISVEEISNRGLGGETRYKIGFEPRKHMLDLDLTCSSTYGRVRAFVAFRAIADSHRDVHGRTVLTEPLSQVARAKRSGMRVKDVADLYRIRRYMQRTAQKVA